MGVGTCAGLLLRERREGFLEEVSTWAGDEGLEKQSGRGREGGVTWGAVKTATLHGVPPQQPFMARAGPRKASRAGQHLKPPGGVLTGEARCHCA